MQELTDKNATNNVYAGKKQSSKLSFNEFLATFHQIDKENQEIFQELAKY